MWAAAPAAELTRRKRASRSQRETATPMSWARPAPAALAIKAAPVPMEAAVATVASPAPVSPRAGTAAITTMAAAGTALEARPAAVPATSSIPADPDSATPTPGAAVAADRPARRRMATRPPVRMEPRRSLAAAPGPTGPAAIFSRLECPDWVAGEAAGPPLAPTGTAARAAMARSYSLTRSR